jgi:hypothetical protein
MSFNFWDKDSTQNPLSLQASMTGPRAGSAREDEMVGTGMQSMSVLLAPPVPRALKLSSGYGGSGAVVPDEPVVRFGMLPQGTCARCFNSICGGVNPNNGRPLPARPCAAGEQFNCYYPSEAACNANQPQRQMLAASLSAAPFQNVMKTVYSQPNYADALQTFFAGKN